MSFRALLTHRAHIQARSADETTRDPLGHHPSDENVFVEKAPPELSVPCRVQTTNVLERFTAQSQFVADEMFVLYFLPDVSIGESDRIAELTTDDGSVIARNLDVTGVKRIAGRLGKLHHIEAIAFEFRSGVTITWPG